MKHFAYLFVAAAAILWGMIGLFVHKLYELGFTAIDVVAIRVITAALILVFIFGTKDSSLLKIKFKDVKYFVGTGIFSIIFFNWCFFTAIQETSLSVAAILLYTGPAFVTILSRILFKEWLTYRKVMSLGLTLVGCTLVIGLLPSTQQSISLFGLIVGLGSGLGYALYSIFGKFALEKYHSFTVTTYTFVTAGLVMLPFLNWNKLIPVLFRFDYWLYSLGLGIFPTVLAYILYTIGLSQIESSRASITSTLEPVVAAVIGTLLFGDVLSIWQYGGIVFILVAVVMVQEKRMKRSAIT